MINHAESIDFLTKEYGEAYTHMRHYDSISYSFITFAFTFDLAALTASLTIYNYFLEKNQVILKPLGYLLMLATLVGLLLLLLSVRNRVYFVRVARHVNSIRKFFKDNMEVKFDFGNMYLDPQCPKYFNWLSTYSLTFYLISFINAVMFSVAYCSVIADTIQVDWRTLVIAFLVQVVSVISYLMHQERTKG